MPVDRGGLGKLVLDANLDLVSPFHAKRRAEVGSVHSPGLGRLVRQQCGATLLQRQLENLAPVLHLRLKQGRDGEFVLEGELADGADLCAGIDHPPACGERQRSDRSETKGPT